MNRFFCPSKNITGDKITVTDRGQIHHIKEVLRFKINDEIVFFDDKGREYISIIEKMSAQNIILKIKRVNSIGLSGKTIISVACAIPKKSKMDDIVDKLTQLGVDRIIPLITERVIVKLDEKKKNLRRNRWEKIALNSAKQSQRNTIAAIEPIKTMEEALQECKNFDLKLIGALTGKRKPLKEVLDKTKAGNVLIFIGPEGDFTPEELMQAKSNGCIPVSLGELVLRVETAAVAVASFIRLYFGTGKYTPAEYK